MSNPSPFVRDSLVPEGGVGGQAGVYQITATSVSPTITTRDARGMPVEETVPHGYWEWWIGLSGCAKRVPMRTAAVFDRGHEATLYQNTITADHLRAGQLPAWVCPFTNDYRHVTGGPLATPGPGDVDCGGSGPEFRGGIATNGPTAPRVCAHMQKVINERLIASRKLHDETQQKVEQMSTEQVEKMTAGMATAFGQALATHAASMDPRAAKDRMKSGKGEE